MAPAHQSQIELLFGIVGLLLTVIFVAVFWGLYKSSRRQKVSDKNKEAAVSEDVTLASIDSTGQIVSDYQETPVPEVVPEKEVDLKEALKKTEENLFGRIRSLFKTETSNQHLDEIEEILYTSDLGPATVQRLMGALETHLSKKEKTDYALVRNTIKDEIVRIFSTSETDKLPDHSTLAKIRFVEGGPTILMIVGVNGAGKTTSIGKISAQLAAQGKKVLVAAGDTFRAAAGGQLKVWTDRAQVEIFSPEGVTDPSAVAFDAVAKGKAQGYDVVIVDTAGRLHTQANLMEEIKKMKRVMTKVIPDAPHEVLIVLDANSGQNALMQAKEFHQALGLTGAILTKMDGTAKGGVAVGLAQELQIPIKLIGVGERIQDLRSFSSKEFVESLFQ
ncbi:Signal recognition particle receptor FtsY [compost metagenome]